MAFRPLGQIVTAEGQNCQVAFRADCVWFPVTTLLPVSIRSTQNLRLLTHRLDPVLARLSAETFRSQLLMFTQQGDWAARAFADYAAKIPLPILTIALENVLAAWQTQAPDASIATAMDQVLGLNFALVTGQPLQNYS